MLTYFIRIHCRWIRVTTSVADYLRVPHAIVTGGCKAGPAALMMLLAGSPGAAPGALPGASERVAVEPALDSAGFGDPGNWGGGAFGWGSEIGPELSGDESGACCGGAAMQQDFGFAAGLWHWTEPATAPVAREAGGAVEFAAPVFKASGALAGPGILPDRGVPSEAPVVAATVPEPSALALFGVAAGLIGVFRHGPRRWFRAGSPGNFGRAKRR